MAKRGTETVEIKRYVSTGDDDDFYGDTSTQLAVVATLQECIIWPRASSADADRGVTTISGLHIFVPPDAIFWDADVPLAEQELTGEDHVVARGKDWQLDGDAGDWRKPKTGRRLGWLFEVKRWSA